MSSGQNPLQGGMTGFAFGGQPASTTASNIATSGSGGFSFATPTTQQAPLGSTGGLGTSGSGSFSFGLQQTTAPATSAAPAPGFSFGSGTGGLTMTAVAPQPATSQPTYTGTAPGSFSFGLAHTTAPPTSAAVAPVSAVPVSSTVAPQLTAMTSSLFTGFGTPSTATTASTGFSLGSSLAQTTPATTATATTSSAPSLLMKPISTTSSALGFTGFSTTTSAAATNISMSAGAAPATTSYSQLAENLNKWVIDLEDNEKQFLTQATQVNAWDTLLSANAQRIVHLHESVERVKGDQSRLDRELDFIRAQQQELDECLAPLEKSLEDKPSGDPEREKTYHLAESIDAQLKRMTEDMKEIIEHLNNTQQTVDNSDPISQIARILNAHMNSLQWVDQNMSLVQSKLDEVSKLQDSHRHIHENNFNMTYS